MNNNTKNNTATIDDDMINKTIMAIESTEPTPEELEAAQLAKLVPSIRMAMDRGESKERITKKIKTVFPKLHYSKVDALFTAAAKLPGNLQDGANPTDQQPEDSQ